MNLDTDRLVLRVPTASDFEDSAAMWGDAEVTRHIGGKPSTREECWARILRHVGHWAVLGFGYWTVRERGSGAFVGDVGFLNLKRDIDPPLGNAPEIGWVLSPRAHGRGFATEAARAALAWGDAHFSGATTVCIIVPEHRASLRVAEKCGFQPARRALYHGDEVIVLERAVTMGDPERVPQTPPAPPDPARVSR
jgi:RimJ/RimL family protein N-acetyltransferase